jgi:hypothetical protein
MEKQRRNPLLADPTASTLGRHNCVCFRWKYRCTRRQIAHWRKTGAEPSSLRSSQSSPNSNLPTEYRLRTYPSADACSSSPATRPPPSLRPIGQQSPQRPRRHSRSRNEPNPIARQTAVSQIPRFPVDGLAREVIKRY